MPRKRCLHLPPCLLRALLALLAFAAAAPAPAQLDPEKALASMRPAEGLQVSLFAAEPMLQNPTCIDVDPYGRVWVCEGVNHRGKANPPFRKTGDRIVRLEDSDGDGRADRSIVFYEGLDLEAPLGICYLGGRVLVSQSPEIFSIEVRPDGTAGERKGFLAGFGGVNHDHGVHSVVLGPDGLLYGAFGNGGAHVTDRSGRTIRSDGRPFFGGMVFRTDLDASGSEVLAHNFRNNYECALDSFGNIWQSDNDDDGNQWVRFTYVMQGGNYGYLGPTGRHWDQEGKSHFHMEDPGVVPTLLRTGAGSPTGLCVYEGALLPERYRGMPIHADAGPRVVQCFQVRPLGAGWHVEGAPLDEGGRQTIETLSRIVRPEVLLTSADSFFRPSDVAVAPDGSLLVADWYDPGVGGHGMGDTSRGRIWRLEPREHEGYAAPAFDLSSDGGLAAALASPCLASRSLAALELLERDRASLPLLLELERSKDPVLRARALWLLARTEGGRERVEAALLDPEARFRVLAVRGLKLAAPRELVRLVRPLLGDPDPQVRREVLVALRDVGGEEALHAIVTLAGQHDGRDRWLLEAIAIASRGREGAVFLRLAEGWKGAWTPAAGAIAWALHPPEAARLLEERLRGGGLSMEALWDMVRTLAAIEDAAAGRALLGVLGGPAAAEVKREAAAALEPLLASRWTALRSSEAGAVAGAARALLGTPGLEEQGARLAAAGGAKALRGELEALARSGAPGQEAARAAAARALGALDQRASIPVLAELAAAAPQDLAREAASALASMCGAEPQDALKRVLLEASSPETRSAAVKALGETKSGALLLLHLAQAEELPEAARALATTVVGSSAFEDVRLIAKRVLPPPAAAAGKEVPPIAELVARKGSSSRGRRAFFDEGRANCGRCHRIGRKGSDVGPDLSAIGAKLGREGLYEAVLSPSSAISHEYKVWILQTRSAGFVTGYIVDETPEKLTIRDANGKPLSFAKDDVTAREPSDASLMPEGLAGAMTVEDLVDIVELLSRQGALAGQGARSVQVREWMLAAPFPNEDDRGLDATYPPEEGVDLAAEHRGRDGPVRWRRVEAAPDGYLDLARAIRPSDRFVAYLFMRLESPRDQEAEIALGSDDGVKVWLNGELVHSNHVHRAAEPEQDRLQAKLRNGLNDLLVKVDNGDGPTGIYVTVETAEPVQPRAAPKESKTSP
ncbi:MAG: HEAT repeat domain-containing protein [Planctomycetes bacterium]|nr:HEAT repeat domain-containing protein [Planctomycetota bacterium]